MTPALQKGDLWKAYQEARVLSAVTDAGVKLFVHLSMIEIERMFELYQTLVLPVYSASENIGVQYTPLPPFLAVDADRQTFVELSTDEARLCIGPISLVCPPSGAIYRKNFKKHVQWHFIYRTMRKKGTSVNKV